MGSILKNRTFALLFSAQVVALLGTGLLTVALGLLAFDLAGARAGVILGTAYTIKMVAYVGLSPIAQALVVRWPRRTVLVTADIARASVALCLPFVDAVWQVYVLIFVLQAASATFTPAFQAAIPDILPDEAEYTKALSLSRLAYDLENLLSPALAGLLLLVVSYSSLFLGTVAGFLISTLLILRADVPPIPHAQTQRPFRDRLTRGTRIYLATPRLRGLLSLNFGAAAISAFVLVNTVVLTRGALGGTETDMALAMAAYGAGSMVAALMLPRLLEQMADRSVMVPASLALGLVAVSAGASMPLWSAFGLFPLMVIWLVMGALYSAILTPAGRLLKRSAHSQDRPAIFAAQFALSHMCWLITYPLAGWAGLKFGLGPTLALMGVLVCLGTVLAVRLWPADQEGATQHDHPELPADHPHLADGAPHRHPIVIDDLHPRWPTMR